jgi:DNA-binding NtrC family response regulator
MRFAHDEPVMLEKNEGNEQGAHLLKDLIRALSFALEAITNAESSDVTEGVDFYEEVRRFEIGLIKRALKETQGNQAQAARLLKLNQTTLHGKIKQYGITPTVVVYSEEEAVIGRKDSGNLVDRTGAGSPG